MSNIYAKFSMHKHNNPTSSPWEILGDMGFLETLIRITCVSVILSEFAVAVVGFTYPIARPNCSDRCGDMKIPYPFGLREGCYLDHNFFVNCTNSSEPFIPTHMIVKNISLHGQIDTLMYVARDCYEQGVKDYNNSTNPWLASPLNFTVSSTQNKFVVVGCDTVAYLVGYQQNERYATGCASVCESTRFMVYGSCTGVGCCEVDIPKGLKNVTMESHSFQNHTMVENFNPCGYALISKQDTFNFSIDSLRTLRDQQMMPMVLDWAIGNETCNDIENKSNYICGDNSSCQNSEDRSGYRCKCKDGYDGNPYLPTGCHGVGISFIVMLVCSSWLYLMVKQRKLIKLRQRFFEQNGGLILQQKLSKPENSTATAKIFTTEELKKATNNYDETLIIGRGGFGTVYKGLLLDNRIVAIKKSKTVDESQIEQFINEVVVLSQINHRNVVKLLGCCLETQVPLLVYEFIPNGTLFEYIHHKNKESTVSWEIRLRIAAETAEALSYLHFAASPPIIHRDVKSSNILLDSTHTAKVSDFGASRLVPLDQTQLATMVQGTLGYLDPEYMQTSQLTEKSDVYSFGVVLVELLTGEKALSFDKPEEERSLAIRFLSFLKDNRLFEILEKHIAKEGKAGQLKEVANLAKRCLRLKGEDRPTMKEVATELEGLRKMEMHSWVNVDSNSEETEFLLGETSDSCKYNASNKSTNVYDSVRDHVIFDLDDGR
ncbi:putative wall-associated receptor kinase-like 16 isoform X3 [Quercus robur]|uniref:putative wall-associated receptor kinase-like 16 isoform X3 n=1 Tax=Quercus robur TaxID=38942 RepID=UPI002163D71F|nr:putative wall-associated receptor kinase-like 16 isoform X3 [Quercus robur]